MYTDIPGEEIYTVYHEFHKPLYKLVSAMTLDIVKVDIVDSCGNSIKFQIGKIVLIFTFQESILDTFKHQWFL